MGCISPLSLFPISIYSSSPSPRPSKSKHYVVSKAECNNGGNPNNKPDHIVGNRRDVLIGIGGLCGAGGLNQYSAMAAPIPPPNLETCDKKTYAKDERNYCPPAPSAIIDFQFPPSNESTTRVRPAAHLVKREYLDKYKEAIRRMKNLPANDPRSFTQQANVHSAYCEGHYDQLGFPGVKLQVHCSWLFFPFHRWYLYFHERILGNLIGDPTFALPFWNWDHPHGMIMPRIYTEELDSPLYDSTRTGSPGTLVNLDDNHAPQIIDPGFYYPPITWSASDNLVTMYKQVVSLGKVPSLFLGSPYRAGSPTNAGAGSLEQKPHNTLHGWVGGHLGNFKTAGQDPMFFAHHANVDRMWNIWKTKVPGGKRRDFTDPDWLESSFLFYDENANLVRVKVKDCLDSKKMGYVFQEVEIPWLNAKPTPRYDVDVVGPPNLCQQHPHLDEIEFPFDLKSPLRVILRRPLQIVQTVNDTEEVLVVHIDCDDSESKKIDVLINVNQGYHTELRANHTEFAGSFVSLSHSETDHPNNIDCCPLRLGISEVLKDLKVQNHECISVTLVPRNIGKSVKITGIKLEVVKE